MKASKTLALATAVSALAVAAQAETKIGMITTRSGGGASLGVDTRDGFMLAMENAGRDDVEVVIEDDQRKPATAVQIADQMIQSEKVDILTGIVWSNLAMAVVPSAPGTGLFYLSTNDAPAQPGGNGRNTNTLRVPYQK